MRLVPGVVVLGTTFVLLRLAGRAPSRFALMAVPMVVGVLLVAFAVPNMFRLRFQMSLMMLVGGAILGVLYSRTWVDIPIVNKGAIRS